MVDHRGNLVVCSLTAFQYGALKVQVAAGERVIKVYIHFVLSDCRDVSHEAGAVFVLQRNDGSDGEVKVALIVGLGECNDMLLDIFAISLIAWYGEIKSVILSECAYNLFETWDSDAESGNKYERLS